MSALVHGVRHAIGHYDITNAYASHIRTYIKASETIFTKFRSQTKRVVVLAEWFYVSVFMETVVLLSPACVQVCIYVRTRGVQISTFWVKTIIIGWHRISSAVLLQNNKTEIHVDNQEVTKGEQVMCAVLSQHRLLFFGEKYFLIKVNRYGIV